MNKIAINATPKNIGRYQLAMLIFTIMIGLFTLVQSSQQANALDGYKLCAMREGVCKCKKTGDPAGIFTEMEKDKCTAQPEPVKTPATTDKTSAPTLPKTIEPAPEKASSGFQLFNIKLPDLIPKKEVKYRLCALRKGTCKCQKVGDAPGTLTEVDMSLCPRRPSVTKDENSTLPTITPAGSPLSPKQASAKTIKTVQIKLNNLGYDAGKADGISGKQTTKAISAFQKAAGLPVNGKINGILLQRLGEMTPEDVSKPVYVKNRSTTAKTTTVKKTQVLKKAADVKKTPTAQKLLKPVPMTADKENQAAANPPATAETSTTKPPAATSFPNPLAGLFDGLKSKPSLPNSASGFKNCALRTGECLCQKVSDEPGVWTTMDQSVCMEPQQETSQPEAKKTTEQPVKAVKKK